jgi:flagellar hook-associated protein 2
VGALGLSGLASGVDTGSIVAQLMALERMKTTKLGYRQAAVTGEQAALKDLAAKLNAFKTAALALKSPDAWKQTQTVESSDPARLGVAKVSGAGIGGHTLTVSRLAASAQRTYAWTPPAADFQLDVAYSAAGSPTTSITVAAGATAAQVAEKVNALATSPVYAAVTKDSAGNDQLVLSARKSGQGGVFDVTSPELTPSASKITNLDASFTVDGTAGTSETNVLESAIPGLRLTLKGVTSDPITVTLGEPALDREAVKTKVKAMVDAYNAVVTSTRSKLTEKNAAVPGSDFEAARGQLFGDTQLSGMLSRLRQQVTALGAGAMDDLADIGIGVPRSTGALSEDAKAGKLVIDEAKLAAALEQDHTLVKDVLNGFATEMDTFVTAQTKGLDSRVDSGNAKLRMLADQVERTNERLDLREKRMTAQFAAMEMALQASQTQGAWLSGQLAALNRTSA